MCHFKALDHTLWISFAYPVTWSTMLKWSNFALSKWSLTALFRIKVQNIKSFDLQMLHRFWKNLKKKSSSWQENKIFKNFLISLLVNYQKQFHNEHWTKHNWRCFNNKLKSLINHKVKLYIVWDFYWSLLLEMYHSFLFSKTINIIFKK